MTMSGWNTIQLDEYLTVVRHAVVEHESGLQREAHSNEITNCRETIMNART